MIRGRSTIEIRSFAVNRGSGQSLSCHKRRHSLKLFSWFGLAAAALLAAGAAQAQTGRLLVAQKGDRSLAIVDPVAGKVIADVAENGITGHEVAGSADGRLAFVPIYGNSGVGKPGTDGKNIVVVDVATSKVVGDIRVRPWGAAALRGDRAEGRNALRDHRAGQSGDDHRPEDAEDCGRDTDRAGGEPHAGALARRATRLHGECGAGNGERARCEGAQDAHDHSCLGQRAADRDFK